METEIEQALIQKFAKKKILVIGDVMLDKYIHGNISRLSPEAPVQIMNVMKEEYVLGGAANVAANASALGAQVYLVGVVGNDSEMRHFERVAKERNVLCRCVEDVSRCTTCKTRMIGYNLQACSQQLLRIDYENREPISKDIEDKLMKIIQSIFCMNHVEWPSVIIFSDYAKGTLTKSLVSKLMEFANENKLQTIAAPKPINKHFYKNVDLVIMNKSEAKEMSGINSEKIDDIGNSLLNEFTGDIIITMGPEGVAAFKRNEAYLQMPAKSQKISDVTGAGDTFAAVAALVIASGASLHQIVTIANYAAGIVVSKPGTATVSVDEITHTLKNNY